MPSLSASTPETYWSKFEVGDDDLEFITNLLLEREVPLTSWEMAAALIGHRLELLKQEAQAAADASRTVYLPGGEYQVGEELVFTLQGNQVGKVVGVREGQNPELGSFDVIRVEFGGDGSEREYAARLADHELNRPPEPAADEQPDSPELILGKHKEQILGQLTERLEQSPDIVYIAGRWFPEALLAEITVGHLNLAEAVLDVAQGGPLPTAKLLEHVETPKGLDPLLTEFSFDYALQEDERFDEVGPAGQVLWHLKRLEPPEALVTPARLEYESPPHDRHSLTEELLATEIELDDEHSPLAPAGEHAGQVTLPLIYPHWRVGSLPLSSKLTPFFPTAYDAPRIRFILVDGQTGQKFPGWVVRKQKYVFGLNHWYRHHDIPAGGLVRVTAGEDQGEVIVEPLDRRQRNDWIRTVSIDDSGRIGFTMLKQPIGTAYDDLMVVGLIDPEALEEAWAAGDQRRMPVERLVAHVFRELAKLNPQAAVHAKSLYSGANVIRRLAPAVIFHELVTQPYYVHVGDSYWRLDETIWKEA